MDLSIAFKNIERFISLSEEEKNIFESLIEVLTINRNETLLKEGQICQYEYFVIKGCLRSFYTAENLMEHTTMFAIEGWWTGNLKSFLKDIPSEFAIQAQECTTVVRIHKSKIEELYSRIPKFERYFRILLQNRLLETQDRVRKHLSATAAERYQTFLAKYPEMEQRVPLKHIASYLGITPTYLSRLRRKRMQKNLLY